MKEQILKLRSEGKTYSEIQKEVGCSRGTISFHCGLGQKEKTNLRTKKRRENPLTRKTDIFRVRSSKNVVESLRKFQKRIPYDKNVKVNKILKKTFTWKDVLAKFGRYTKCYLTGENIDLLKDEFSFDHIIPFSKGGNNTLDNLGICLKKVNMMKTDLFVDEFLDMCKKILENNGYKISVS